MKYVIAFTFFFLSLDKFYSQKSEFRGVWIASVNNIDWPKNALDSNEKKKEDFLKLIKFYKDLNFNAVIVQIRTAGDAFYPTRFAPYSRFLTGKEGVSPQGDFDFTKWMIDVAHKNGMEFHAWINPYRATTDLNKKNLSPKHDVFQHSDWMIQYGNRYYYDPGLPQVEAHLLKLSEEILDNYDIDALHFDDYFYPYKIAGKNFNDRNSYLKYREKNQSLEQWRRSNVDSLIFKLHRLIEKKKPWVDFGISPFGIWRNKDRDPRGSDTRGGQSNYDDLYADPLLWAEKGWIDYLVPQLYWSLDYPVASHRVLAKWWNDNAANTKIYIGNAPYKINDGKDRAWYQPKELEKQIELARATKNIYGNVLFSAKSLLHHTQITQELKQNIYQNPALVPKTKRDSAEVLIPQVVRFSNLKAEIQIPEAQNMRWLCIYEKQSGVGEQNWILKDKVFVTGVEDTLVVLVEPFLGLENHAFSLIDLYKNESQKVQIPEFVNELR